MNFKYPREEKLKQKNDISLLFEKGKWKTCGNLRVISYQIDASTSLSMTEIKSKIYNLEFPSKFHIPKEILFLEKFPRAENGKVLRREILKIIFDTPSKSLI